MTKKYEGYDIFKNRTLIIATMHKKEQVMSSILQRELNVNCITIPNFNTDNFGTFTGETDRKDNALTTVKLKALKALEITGETLVVASEGSFGRHPSCFFAAANEETIILIDTKNKIEIKGWHLTSETNFAHQTIKNLNELKEFEKRVGFPAHGIILKTKKVGQKEKIWKTFRDSRSLSLKVSALLKTTATIKVETDMRAMYNPTRMKAIELATIDLIKNIKSLCPECNAPGFSVSELIKGLICSLCKFPTKSIMAYMYSCNQCSYSCERAKENVTLESPMYCDNCNP